MQKIREEYVIALSDEISTFLLREEVSGKTQRTTTILQYCVPAILLVGYDQF